MKRKLSRVEKKYYKLLIKNKEWLNKAIQETADRIISYPESLLWH